jgi:hypothetical protein
MVDQSDLLPMTTATKHGSDIAKTKRSEQQKARRILLEIIVLHSS